MKYRHDRCGSARSVASAVLVLPILCIACGSSTSVAGHVVTVSSDRPATGPTTARSRAVDIVPRATSVQCRVTLATLITAVELYYAQRGAFPPALSALVPAFAPEFPVTSSLDPTGSVLTVTEFAVIYSYTYERSAGTVIADTLAPKEAVGPGCP